MIKELLEDYFKRVEQPLRNTEVKYRNKKKFNITHVIEDDEFRILNHRFLFNNKSLMSIWRHQDWMMGDRSIDFTFFYEKYIKSISIRYFQNSILGAKLSLTRPQWLISDPDFRLPYIFGKSDIEMWYYLNKNTLDLQLSKCRLAYDYSSKHSLTILDHGIEKNKGAYLYKNIEYRYNLDKILNLDISDNEIDNFTFPITIQQNNSNLIFNYIRGYGWINGWKKINEFLM
ncbi:MAG: hypothetical protein CL748_00530 [Chloroflexi bacterium]|nr:hypothetical protein [Chloroflexota bacterium]|tara:strand:- start:196 stop:885 length:690 start_codon:yes stop_codon:yes gene_type:complete